MLKINDLLEGKYEILRQIGKGGMSIVYLAMDTRLNKQWAIKELPKSSSIQNAIAEINLIKKLDHPSFPRIVDIIERDDSICIIMDYIEGKSLDFVIKEYGIPDQKTVIEWGKQLTVALSYLHHQNPPIIYRDMKPGNIMLQPNGNLKIIDFGIAREYKQSHLEDTIALGTRGYAAPEQYQNTLRQSDERTDIYCLGVTLHHLVTGISPNDSYDIVPIRTINPLLSSGLENILLKCTQKNPNHRYKNCEELLYALEHYEQEDDAYKLKIKKRMRFFLCTFSLSILCLLLSISLWTKDVHIQTSDYHNLLIQASKNPKISKEYLYQAIDAIPDQKDAYIQLIEFYKASDFNQKESSLFISKTSSSLEKYKEKNPYEYALIAYEIGKLYWYYFDDMNSIATFWFNESLENGIDEKILSEIKAYIFIGSFNKEILKMRNEGTSTTEMYERYFYEMKTLFQEMSDQEDMIRLQMDSLIMNSIEGYIHDFKKSISKEAIMNLYTLVVKDVNEIQADTEKTMEIKNQILERNTIQSIENAYAKATDS